MGTIEKENTFDGQKMVTYNIDERGDSRSLNYLVGLIINSGIKLEEYSISNENESPDRINIDVTNPSRFIISDNLDIDFFTADCEINNCIFSINYMPYDSVIYTISMQDIDITPIVAQFEEYLKEKKSSMRL